jgi:hypothetical protein
LPSLINLLLRVLTRNLQALNLPPEILANAIFQLLEDIDQVELSGVVNALAEVINALHRGNLLLGRDEPRFKEVAARVSKGLVDNVDGEQLKQALLALGEDGRVIGGVVSGYLLATPESTAQVVKAVHTAINAALRAVAENGAKLAELPPQVISDLAEDFEQRFEGRELGRILNNQMLLYNKLCRENPDFLAEILKRVLSAVEPEAWAAAGKATALQVREAVLASPEFSALLQPEAIGDNINAGLAAFNRFLGENPNMVVERVSRALAVVDTDELRQALIGIAGQMAKSAARNRAFVVDLAKPLIKPVAVGAAAVGGLLVGLVILRKIRN